MRGKRPRAATRMSRCPATRSGHDRHLGRPLAHRARPPSEKAPVERPWSARRGFAPRAPVSGSQRSGSSVAMARCPRRRRRPMKTGGKAMRTTRRSFAATAAAFASVIGARSAVGGRLAHRPADPGGGALPARRRGGPDGAAVAAACGAAPARGAVRGRQPRRGGRADRLRGRLQRPPGRLHARRHHLARPDDHRHRAAGAVPGAGLQLHRQRRRRPERPLGGRQLPLSQPGGPAGGGAAGAGDGDARHHRHRLRRPPAAAQPRGGGAGRPLRPRALPGHRADADRAARRPPRRRAPST